MYVWKVGVGKDQEKQTKEHIEYFASPEVEKVKKKGKWDKKGVGGIAIRAWICFNVFWMLASLIQLAPVTI